MREEIREKLDAIARLGQETINSLIQDPAVDALFARRLVGQTIATMEMKLDEQYGIRLRLTPPQSEEPATDVTAAPAQPKPKAKKNSR